MTNNLLRPMQTADLSAVLLIEREQAFPWSEQMFHECLQVGYECWVIEVDQAIIGFGILAIAAGQAELLTIAVRQTNQRQGYARLLLQHLLALAVQKGAVKIFLEVRVSNQAAINLYQQFAFKPIATRENYYQAPFNKREDAIVMMLTI